MGLRERSVERPAPETCHWPLEHPEYLAWLTRSNIDLHRGLLRLIGHPGSGKSVLMKALAAVCKTRTKHSEIRVATFFFSASGTSDQKSMLGLLKALLLQLLPLCEKTSDHFKYTYDLKAGQHGDSVEWCIEELQDILLGFFSVPRDTPIYMFIDAVDECENVDGDGTDARSVANFLQELAETAYCAHSNLSICVSSRRFPTVGIRYCADVFVDVLNHGDIEQYVSRELHRFGIEPSIKFNIKDVLISKAGGVFLWAQLVLSSIAQSFDEGFNLDLSSVLSGLEELPETLRELFDRILENLSSQERLHALRLFQWAVLAQRPISADEWIHILAFVDDPELRSIKGWREGKYGVRDMEQLAKRLRNMTGGLLEVALQEASREDNHSEILSGMRPISVASVGSAIAGSMEPYGPENFVVRFIHLSACQYFLTGDGFKLLGQAAPPACFGAGHIYIAATCLRYTQLEEIKPLILSRSPPPAMSSLAKRLKRLRNKSDTNLSVVSFGSSAANSVRRRSLPASLPPSTSAKNTTSDELPGETHTPLTLELLETHLRGLGTVRFLPEDEPQDDAHSRSEDLENARSECSPGLFDGLSVVEDSLSARSATAVLLDDPVLRLYAVEMFMHHAAAANQDAVDPSALLDVLHDDQLFDGRWYRWCRLNDDGRLQSDTTPAYFAAEKNLGTWIKWYSNHPSCRNHLYKRGGKLRYPLLAAIHSGHDSIVACLSDQVDAEVPVTDPWTLLHSLSANKFKSDTTLEHRQFNHELLERLFTLSAIALSDATFVDGLPLFLRSYIEGSGVSVRYFQGMLVLIRALKPAVEYSLSTNPQYETAVDKLLADVFWQAD
jgi:energy-coupling factor transporter ATP-binding protein EcfA2